LLLGAPPATHSTTVISRIGKCGQFHGLENSGAFGLNPFVKNGTATLD
jgi:hypothetical protein